LLALQSRQQAGGLQVTIPKQKTVVTGTTPRRARLALPQQDQSYQAIILCTIETTDLVFAVMLS
jgi:hypothetical protein